MYGILRDNTIQFSNEFVFKDELGNDLYNVTIEQLKDWGFKEIIDIKPQYNEVTEYLNVKSYTENEMSITVNYEVLIKEKRDKEKIKELEEKLKVTQEALDFILMGGI